MSPCRLRLTALFLLTFAASATAMAAPTPQNQCPGDCSPCLGPSDPFCSSDTLDNSTNSRNFCVRCDSPTSNCRDARAGETGKDASCTVVTEGMRVVSCTAAGNSCQGTTVTP